MEDKELPCACGNTFTFTKGEQEFYERKQFPAPKRCANCRAEKKRNNTYES